VSRLCLVVSMAAPLLSLAACALPSGPLLVHGLRPVPSVPVYRRNTEALAPWRAGNPPRQSVGAYQPSSGSFAPTAPLAPTPLTIDGSTPGPVDYAPLNQPYVMNGRSFLPRHQTDYDATGVAVVSQHADLGGQRLTALHATLPVPSLITITNLDNECSIIVRIVGRGATSYDRIVEVSAGAGRLLRISGRGDVRVEFKQPASLDGNTTVELGHVRNYPDVGCAKSSTGRP
jgi:hypothetical protein